MRYKPLGNSGLMVSTVGLGGNNFGRTCDLDRTRSVIETALEVGVNFIDTSDSYGVGRSETFIGEVLGSHRDDVIISTKFGYDMQGANGPDHGARGSRRYIVRAVEASLRRLRTDRIDLYQYHFPDGITPIEETLTALDVLITAGKVCYVGSSNIAGWQVVHADWVGRELGCARFISTQAEYSLLRRSAERELVEACSLLNIGVIPWYPLANGLLTGKYHVDQPAPPGSRLADRLRTVGHDTFCRIAALEAFGQERGRSLLEVAISGLAAQPCVSVVIAGATSPQQVEANVAAARWTMSADDLRALDDIVPRGEAWI